MEIVRFAVAVIFALSSISSSNAATTPTTPPSGGAGDAHSMPCIQKLMPCQPYLHSSAPLPPASCCMPLKEIVETDVTCLCSVFNNVDMLRSLNLTKENALVLPKACGANADVSQCKTSTGTTTPSTSPGTTKTPPASPAESGSAGGSASSTAKPSDSAPAINFAGISLASAFVALATIFF
ncbi:Bifunctional inhibitor/lipid-transfer protein/seed storage 2S albumin superfamily protein [Raphanus sativus]|uniref:Non-specific lipid transfer protein GPI-anchored 3 n=1 Tax=Raphanus sativus TaxID=3726 RepID=A0A6J0KPQ8_RAPSA|nr:non-specific lipid transfer protein GPI-anchored 3 [Raphanus sativus]XP_056857536.1 non-specific lipid transfer protein GPI-anchored 3-like [Raphanus sativus]KAJ4866459.1 Bifunctional inhibitor/lipid-transfer protein/seed storage 2S albumin superfamily protein [Raphanus sativus]KAJ4879453.1 Bifunctional inhibitor/lipid-transfer protein/seed storage 2S albumin superfamily protein [Raphanus sativus]